MEKVVTVQKKKIQLFFFSEFIIFTKMMVGSFEGKWRSRKKNNQKWKNTGEAKERTEKIFRKRKKEIQKSSYLYMNLHGYGMM